MTTIKNLNLVNDTIKELHDNMENDLQSIRESLNNLILQGELYGYQFSTPGGLPNFNLEIYPKSHFKIIELGKDNNLEPQFSKFKDLSQNVKMLATEFNEYMILLKNCSPLKNKFVDLYNYEDNQEVNKTNLNKTTKLKM